MKKVDLWADDPIPEDFGAPEPAEEPASPAESTGDLDDGVIDLLDDNSLKLEHETQQTAPDMGDHAYHVRLDDEYFVVWSREDFEQNKDYKNFNNVQDTGAYDGLYRTVFRANPFNCFTLVHVLAHQNVDADEAARERMLWGIRTVGRPEVFLAENGRYVEVKSPYVETYNSILRAVNGYPVKSGNMRVNITRVLDLQAMSANLDSKLPPLHFTDEVLELNSEPIEGYDGTVDSLKHISVDQLNVVKANIQSWKSKSKSKKTMAERMADFGIATLHDLMFWLPRRYIDKTKPQELYGLMEGESATIVGIIESNSLLPRDMGVKFNIRTGQDNIVPVTFFRQNWLQQKFPNGTEVLATGKFNLFNRQPQLNGTSIERSEEAAAMPIVPIYNQSESKGITTNFLVSATREMMSRLGGIALPSYFANSNTPLQYHEALEQIHFPESLEHHHQAMDTLAYYELIYLQLIIQELRENAHTSMGIEQTGGDRKLQARAIRDLPFELTTGQKKAVLEMNKNLADQHPSTTLLNADVGSGKTMVSQLACLQSVDSGHQATMLAPTDILGQQLFAALEKLVAPFSDEIRIEYMSGAMKVRERRAILKDLESGDIDILVGTHSVISDTVKFRSLGFIAVDEQQKFGAEQRSKLLNARDDDMVPDLLLQTATPIPRSTAQVLYGDMEMIELQEKPPGRLPIITEWLEEDPIQITEHITNTLWSDIIREAEQGHQTFIITPMVADTGNMEAASVEQTYKNLSKGALSQLEIAYTHGKMKQDEQREVMEKFRNGDYDVLIASTVVEVGVDISNATRVVILSADRLGASSLHQIRGRVGRNSLQSKCYLVSLGRTDNSRIRMESLVKYPNGFDVAKSDLAIRGEGVLFGTAQSGGSDMIFANLAKNSDMITAAQHEAKQILASQHREHALNDAHQKFESGERLY